MLKCWIKFIAVTIIGCSVQLIGDKEMHTQSLRTVVRKTNVTLMCPQPSSNQFDKHVEWYFSPIDQRDKKLINDDMHFEQFKESSSSSLMIRNVTTDDAGMYYCCFEGPCVDIILVVLDFENILSFESNVQDASGEIIVSSEGDFSIKAYHGSETKVDFFKEPNIPICNHFARNVVCYKRNGKRTTTYYLKNAKVQDSGRFVIQPSFNVHGERFILNILIQGKPVIAIVREESEDGITFICSGHAYPMPNVKWYLELKDKEDRIDLSLVRWKQTPVAQSNQTYFTATAVIEKTTDSLVDALVQCIASNIVGTTSQHDSILLEHSRDESVSTHAEDDQVKCIINSPIGSVNVGDTVDVECKASIRTFSNEFVFEYNGTRNSVTGTIEGNVYVANFSITASNNELVICEAQLKSGTKVTKQITLKTSVNDRANVSAGNLPEGMNGFTWLGLLIAGIILILGGGILLLWSRCKSNEHPVPEPEQIPLGSIETGIDESSPTPTAIDVDQITTPSGIDASSNDNDKS